MQANLTRALPVLFASRVTINSNTMPNKAAAPEAPKQENGVPDLAGKRVLVPARIFPKEKPPKGKVGWVAKVLGPSKTAPNHFDVAFPGTLICER